MEAMKWALARYRDASKGLRNACVRSAAMACSPSKNCAGTYGAATRKPFGRWPPATCLVTSFRNSSAKTMARYEDDQQTTLQTGGSYWAVDGRAGNDPNSIRLFRWRRNQWTVF